MRKQPIKKMGKKFEHFTKVDIQISNKHMKDYNHQRNAY